ncbi:hypothetical protein C8J56DRAFT_928296 [Mycena floridula]|nr:hypothetical protein C8J56DRAFT_928296 [Mycena floridula]
MTTQVSQSFTVHIQCSVVSEQGQTTAKTWPSFSVPVPHLKHFAVRPYKWARFVCRAILAGVPGELFGSEQDAILDFDTGPDDILQEKVYFKPHREYVIAPTEAALSSVNFTRDKVESTHWSKQSEGTQDRQTTFRAHLVQREGGYSFFGDDSHEDCDATHLVAFSYPHAYIAGFTRQVLKQLHPELSDAEIEALPEFISDINDIRNGMLMSKALHYSFAKNCHTYPTPTAILVTPGLGLETNDLNPPFHDPTNGHPNLQVKTEAELRAERDICYTIHQIAPDWTGKTRLFADGTDSGSIPARVSERPSPLLLNTIYAAMVLNLYGFPAFTEFINGTRFVLDETFPDYSWEDLQPQSPGPEHEDGDYETPSSKRNPRNKSAGNTRAGESKGTSHAMLEGIIAMTRVRSIMDDIQIEKSNREAVEDWLRGRSRELVPLI